MSVEHCAKCDREICGHVSDVVDTLEAALAAKTEEYTAAQNRFVAASENAAMLGCDNSEMKERIHKLEEALGSARDYLMGKPNSDGLRSVLETIEELLTSSVPKEKA